MLHNAMGKIFPLCDSAEADDTPDDPSMESHPITPLRLSKPAWGAGGSLYMEVFTCSKICQ